MFDPSATQYDWPTATADHLYGEVDHDEPRTTYEFDLLNHMPLALEGMWYRLYPTTRAQEQ